MASWKKVVTSGSNAELNTLVVDDSVVAQSSQIVAGQNNLVITGSVVTNVFDETALIDPLISATEFSGASIEYTAQRPNSVRTGTLMASWSGSSVTFTDISNNDIGETWDLSFNLVRIDDSIRLRAYSLGSGSGDWTVHCMFKLFPNLT
jgi:hypothetical protein